MGRALIIFDFDGTLADSFAESLLAYNRIAPRLHLRTVAGSELPELRRLGIGQLMQALGVPMWKLPRLMIAVRAELLDHFHAVNPIAGIDQALRALDAANHHLAIVTANSLANVQGFLARHDLGLFGSIAAGASIFGKARRLRRLLRAASLRELPAVYVGDTPPDMRAAHEAGILAVGVTWGFADRAPLAAEAPDAIIDDATELPATLARLLG